MDTLKCPLAGGTARRRAEVMHKLVSASLPRFLAPKAKLKMQDDQRLGRRNTNKQTKTRPKEEKA